MTTTTPIPPLVERVAGREVAEGMIAATSAAVDLYRQVEAFAAEHGDAIRAYWDAHDGVAGDGGLDAFFDFDQLLYVFIAIGEVVRGIEPSYAEAMDSVTTERGHAALRALGIEL